ncbi:MAG: heme exporter protein CcmD [Lysobacterales bacterium]|nr:MAG: heme exporter protein CcmD [Xanthomonadales bacterium]
MNLQDFFQMGGYAGYVWSAYGLTALVLVLNWVGARRREATEQESARRRTRTDKETP